MGNTSDVLELARSMALGNVEPEVAVVLKALADEISDLRLKVEELRRRMFNVEGVASDPPSLATSR